RHCRGVPGGRDAADRRASPRRFRLLDRRCGHGRDSRGDFRRAARRARANAAWGTHVPWTSCDAVHRRLCDESRRFLPSQRLSGFCGRRFIREDEPSTYQRELALLRLPDLRYAIVFDQTIFEDAPVGISGWSREKLLQHFDSHLMFVRAATLDELALRLQINVEGLRRTVAVYNEAVARWSDPLSREYLPRPIATPPFYGIVHLGHSATCSTGVVVDAQLRVLDGSGRPIANLYAAGELLGSGVTLGNAFTPGMMLTPALSIGRWLGATLPLG
ncbi:MAG: FAD-binding protein, partial [Gammaproteobacteria bacterium]|nr:FAD-binding protein [Gammaproteobacteria bacterium]